MKLSERRFAVVITTHKGFAQRYINEQRIKFSEGELSFEVSVPMVYYFGPMFEYINSYKFEPGMAFPSELRGVSVHTESQLAQIIKEEEGNFIVKGDENNSLYW